MRAMSYVAAFLMGAFYGTCVGIVIGDTFGLARQMLESRP